jgi:hypothetical protein
MWYNSFQLTWKVTKKKKKSEQLYPATIMTTTTVVTALLLYSKILLFFFIVPFQVSCKGMLLSTGMGLVPIHEFI